jgi:NAD(P)H-flavin reductase
MTASPASHVARVATIRDVGGDMMLVTLDVPDAVRDSYVRPGQYAAIALGNESGYFVLGGREQRLPWEFLLRRGGGLADLIFEANVGTEVRVSNALGGGFPVESARGEPVVIAVTAGAIAAARATVARRIEDGDASLTRLLVGARSVASLPMRDDLDAMRIAGAAVRIILSRDPLGTIRYVQHALAEEGVRDAWVFIAGADAMIADVRTTAHALGVPAARVVSNA